MSIDLDRVRELLDEVELVQVTSGGPPGWVYFIICADAARVKIGFTKSDVYKRMKNLQTGSSSELIMLVKHPGTPDTERALHERFAADCIRGEWFHLTEEITAYMVSTLWAMSELTIRQGGKLETWMAAGIQHAADKLGCCSEGLLEAMGVEDK